MYSIEKFLKPFAKSEHLTIRDVARLLKVSPDTARRNLKALVKSGMLIKEEKGRAHYHGLNPKSRLGRKYLEVIKVRESDKF